MSDALSRPHHTTGCRVFEHEGCQVIHGDALIALRDLVADESVDLVFLDPPYNIGKRYNGFLDSWPSDSDYVLWCREWIDLCISKLKPTGSLYLMASTQSMPTLDLYVRQR